MKPLADSLRPKSISDFIGQSHLLHDGHPLQQAIVNRTPHSMIFWGPSGVGKTTLARIICQQFDGYFVQLSAVLDGVKALRDAVENAKRYHNIGKQTVLFVDEIHRFNKAQQDGFLPHIESGLIILIGATTENPSFECNSALLSRLSVYVLEPLQPEEQRQILQRALQHTNVQISGTSATQIIAVSAGDARRLLNIVEKINPEKTNDNDISQLLQNNISSFDKGGDIFYQQLSAFHKSVRGSSPDAALYWMARMLVGGADPKTIARRLLAIASEDIGNADPRALAIALNAWDVFHRVGTKEGNRAIAQAAVYCAVAPKSNAVYIAFSQAMDEAKTHNDLPVPKHLCNAPTELMNDLGYGQGYRYAHNEPDAIATGQTYFPDNLGEQTYYQPVERGLEIRIKEKLQQLRGIK